MRNTLVVAGACCAVMLIVAPAAGQQYRMAGNWELRDRAARDSAAQAEEAEQESTFQRQRDGDTGRGARGRRGGLSESDRFQIGLLLGMAQTVPAFELTIDDSSVVVTNEGGFTYRVFTDGRTTELPLTGDVSVEAKAKWDDGDLIIEYKPEGGGKLTEAYYLADSGLYLRLEVTVEHGSLPRRVWRSRMYRRVEPSPDASP